MKITYVVSIDLSPAVDSTGHLDDYLASRIAYEASAYPDGATIRLNIGDTRSGVPDRLLQLLDRAGEIILEGTQPAAMRVFGKCILGDNPYAVV